MGELVTIGSPPEGLEEAYRLHFPALMRVAFLMTGSNPVAEDIVQEVFLNCADRLAHLDQPASYLRAAVVNACRRRHRREARFRPLEPADPDHDKAGGPDRAEENDDLPAELVALHQALLRLGDRQRAAVVLRYYAGLPHDEVAEALGCRPATARSLVRRALIELRGALDG